MAIADLASAAARLMAKVRAEKPLVHHITNLVVMNETANITLCAGALPVMAHAKEEVEEMTSAAKALVLNIGTLWPEQVDTMLLAGHCANRCGVPIIFDPVGAGATRLRTATGRRLLEELSIAVTRGNAAEIAALLGHEAKISGVESRGVAREPGELATEFAQRHGCVAAVTGAVDVVTDGSRIARVANGHPMMAAVTGTGCMATSVVAAYAAVESDLVAAAAIALAAYGLAGETAASKAAGPGSLHVGLYDALANLTAESLRAGLRIEVSEP